jgi:hypothetical protein
MRGGLKKTGCRGWGAGIGALVGCLCLIAPRALGHGMEAPPSRRGYAVVVGVEGYGAGIRRIKGCLNDARSMKKTLEGYGFEVALLENPTQSRIREALMEAKERTRGQAFTFYFAGHGTNRTVGAGRGPVKDAFIMPVDSDPRPGAYDKDISADELAKLLRAIPANSRIAILDSCFSGAMMKSAKSLRSMTVRYFSKSVSGGDGSRGGFGNTGSEQDSTERDSKDLVRGPESDRSLCYVVASGPAECAGEDTFGGVCHGVFTYYLGEYLAGKNASWGQVMMQVTAKVAAYTEDQQHPEYTPQFRDRLTFADTGTTAPPPQDVWSLYNTSRPDPSAIDLRMQPEATTLLRNTDVIHLTARVQRTGYLVVLERGTSGTLNRLYPSSPEPVSVTQGKTIELGSFTAEQIGTERIKAILFKSKGAAAKLLAAFDASGKIDLSRAGGKGLDFTDSSSSVSASGSTPVEFATDDLMFEVVPAGN